MYQYNTNNRGSNIMGIGSEGFGFDKPQTDPVYMPIPPVRSVWQQLFSTKPNVVHSQQVVPVGIGGTTGGNVAGLQGQMALQALTDFEASSKKGGQ